MVEWLQIYVFTALSRSPYLSTINHLVTQLVNNQIMLWSFVALFILVLRWLTHPRRYMG